MASKPIKGITIEIEGRTGKLSEALKKSEADTRALTREMREIDSALNINPQSMELLSEKSKIAEDKVKALSETLRILKENQEAVNSGMAKNADGTALSAEQIKQYNREVIVTGATLQTAQKVLDDTNAKIKGVDDSAKNAGKSFGEFTRLVSANLAASAVRGISRELMSFAKAAPAAAIEFESAFAGVLKTVDATEAELSALSGGIRNMALTIPATTTEISAVAEAAGQLGIETENILSFSEVMIGLGESTNLSAEAAAGSLAKFANITKMSQGDFERLGSVIVALGNSYATTEADISEMGKRLAAAGTQAGMNESQIMGVAAAMSSMGIEAEAGGTAMSKTMKQIQKAVELGGDDLESYAKIAGTSAAEFKKAWEKDAGSALTRFVAGLSSFKSEGKSAIVVLDEMGIKEARQSDALLRLSGNYELMERALADAGTAWAENIALQEETQKRYETTESQIMLTKNALNDLGITIGGAVVPTIRELSEGFRDFTEENKEEITELAEGFGKALLLAADNSELLLSAVKNLGVAFIALKGASAVNSINGAEKSVTLLTRSLTLLSSPAGAAAAAVAALLILDDITKKLGGDYPTATSKLEEHTKELEKAAEKSRRLSEAFKEQRAALEGNIEAAHNHARANERLAREILALADAEKKGVEAGTPSAENRALIAAKVEELNKAVPELALAYDQETGALSRSNEEIDRYLKNKGKELEMNAHLEAQAEIRRRLVEIERELADAEERRKELMEELAALPQSEKADYHGNYERESQAIKECNKALQENRDLSFELAREQEELSGAYDFHNEKLKENANAHAEANGKIIESEREVSEAFEETAEASAEETAALEAENRKREEIFDSYAKKTQDIFGTIKEESAVSIGALIENLEKNQEAVKQWSDNLAELADRGVNEGLLAKLREAGPEAAKTVQGLVSASDEELKELNAAFKNGAHTATEAMRKELELTENVEAGKNLLENVAGEMEKNASVPAAAEHTVIKTKEAFDKQVAESDFPGIGKNISRGIANGIWGSMAEVERAAEAAARAVQSASKKELDEHSPSKKMEGIGRNAVGGFINGIIGRIKGVKDSGKEMAQGFITSSYSALTKDKARLEKEIEEIGLWPAKAVRASKNELEEELKEIDALLKEKRDGFIKYGEAVTAAVKNEAKERYEAEKAALTEELSVFKDVKYDELSALEGYSWDFRRLSQGDFDLLKDLTDEKARLISQGYIDEIALIDEKTAAALTGINEEIERELEKLFYTNRGLYEELAAIRAKSAELEKAHEAELKRREEEAEAARLAELNKRLAEAETAEQAERAYAELQEYAKQLDEKRADEKYREDKQRLEEQEKELLESARRVFEEKKRLEDEAAKKVADALSESEKRLNAELTEGYEEEIKKAELAAVEIIKRGPEAAKAILEAYNPDWEQAGKSFIEYFEAGASEMEPEAIEAFYDFGDGVISGFIQGLTDKEQEVKAAVQRILAEAERVARGTLDLHSPSKKYREMGRDTGEGFELGLMDAAPLINRAAQMLGLASLDGLKSSVNDSGDGVSETALDNRTYNGGNVILQIEHFHNESGRDIEDLSEELAFLLKSQMKGVGA